MTPIKVTCAIISMEDKILVVQRSNRMSLSMKWEFPGGKIERGESEIDFIKREIREELNIEIEVVDRLTPSLYSYPAITISLIPYTANYVSGTLKLKEHTQYLWLVRDELDILDWAEADGPIVEEVMERLEEGGVSSAFGFIYPRN